MGVYELNRLRNDLTIDGVHRIRIKEPWVYESSEFPPYINPDGSIGSVIIYRYSVLSGSTGYFDAAEFVRFFPETDSIWSYPVITDSSWMQVPRYFLHDNNKNYVYGASKPYSNSSVELVGFDENMNVFKSCKLDGTGDKKIVNPAGMIFDAERNILIAGTHSFYSSSQVEQNHLYVGKYSPDMDLISERMIYNVMDSSSYPAYIQAIVMNSEGDIFMAGQLHHDYFFGSRAFIISKLDGNLDVLWTYFIQTVEGLKIMAHSVNPTLDGGFILTSSATYTSPNANFSVLFKIPNQPITTSIEDEYLKISPILISPNPGRGQMRIDLGPQLGACQLELYDMGAKLAIQTEVQGTGNIINTSALPAGTYVYKISNAAGFAESGKWVKE